MYCSTALARKTGKFFQNLTTSHINGKLKIKDVKKKKKRTVSLQRVLESKET